MDTDDKKEKSKLYVEGYKLNEFLSLFEDKKRAYRILLHITSQYKLSHEFKTLFNRIASLIKESADPDNAFLYFDDFLKNSPSRSTVLELLVSFKVVGEVLFGIFSQSHSLSLFLINNPDYIFWLVESETLSKKKSRDDYYKEAVDFLSKSKKKEITLRHYRKREYLRIAAREIIKACSFEETMEELSNLADALIEVGVDLAFESYKREKLKDGFAVIGLGKLGNRELNFSSDIDLMFVHKDEDNADFYNRVASKIANILNQNMEGGFVYRVDMRLRPNGAYSPLSLSLDEYENYYSTFGQVWEKLALLKARAVAGSKDVGNRFLKLIEPFVFQKTMDVECIDEIRRLMFKIHRSTKTKGAIIDSQKRNIKKGRGGIREIEFIVNYFQLIYGGKIERLRKINTTEGLKILAEEGFLKKSESEFLKDAYLFFRRIEHKIQLLNEQQTQMLPDDEKGLKSLARKLGMEFEAFLNRYNSYTDRVHEIFKSIFVVDKGLPVFSAVEDLENYLSEMVMDDAKTIAANISEAVKKFKANDIKADEIQKIFDKAFEMTKPVGRFGIVANGLNRVNPVYVKFIYNNRNLFKLFVKLLSIGYAEKFARDGFLLDSLLAPSELEIEELTSKEKQRIEFEITLKLLAGSYSTDDLKITTLFAERLIKEITERFDKDSSLAIVGYGKLATGELFVGGDLDIVFISRNEPYRYEPIVRGIIRELKRFYDVDLRLRPFGDKGTLLCDVEYLDKYFRKDAQSWEKQAAQRSRIIYSGFDTAKLVDIYRRFVFEKPPERCEIFCMLKKIIENKGDGLDLKSSFGGLTTIDFLAQAVGFEKGVVKLSLSTVGILENLEKVGIEWASEIKSIYEFIFRMLNAARIAGFGSKLDKGSIKTIEFLLDESELKEKIEERMAKVKDICKVYFHDCTCN